MKKTIKFLGISDFPKKDGSGPCLMAHFYSSPDEKIKDHFFGFQAQVFFVEKELFQKLQTFNPLTDVSADIRYINGKNVLIDVDKK